MEALLATARGMSEIFTPGGARVLLICLGASAPIWVPLLFVVHCAGKRRVSVRSVVGFLGAESVAFWWMTWAYQHGPAILYALYNIP